MTKHFLNSTDILLKVLQSLHHWTFLFLHRLVHLLLFLFLLLHMTTFLTLCSCLFHSGWLWQIWQPLCCLSLSIRVCYVFANGIALNNHFSAITHDLDFRLIFQVMHRAAATLFAITIITNAAWYVLFSYVRDWEELIGHVVLQELRLLCWALLSLLL